MVLDPFLTLRTEIRIVFELFYLCLIAFEFNNIQLLMEGKVVNKLFNEDFSQDGIEADQTDGLVI